MRSENPIFSSSKLKTLRLNGVAYSALTVKTKEFAEQTSTDHCSPQEWWGV